jgi:hypothetical protein
VAGGAPQDVRHPEPDPARPSFLAAASPHRVATLAAAGLLAAALLALPAPPAAVLVAESRPLDAAVPRLELELPPAAIGGDLPLTVVAETSLSHAVEVAAGAPVATVRLEPPLAGAPPAGWTLRAGRDTAEWAIRRPDVAAAAAHPAPEPWLARVAAEGFFGLVFRGRGSLPATFGARLLVVERHPSLPPEAVVHLHRVEVRR